MSDMYKSTDIEEIKKRLAGKKSGGGGGFGDNKLNFYKFPSGTERVVVRYLPAATGIPGKIVKKHYNLPEVKDSLCLRTHDMDCPICEVLHHYEHKLEVNDWVANSRSYMNALVLTDPTQQIDPKVPQIVGQGEGNLYWVWQKLADPDIGDICDPYKGFNVAYQRTEFNGKFERTVLPKSQPIAATKEEVEAILAKVTDLDKVWRKPDDVFLKKTQELADKLRVVIEQRILSLNPPADSQEAADVKRDINSNNNLPSGAENKKEESKGQGPSTPVTKSNKPASAPDCFGDPKAFYKNEVTGADDPNKQKCISCPFDFICGEEAKKKA